VGVVQAPAEGPVGLVGVVLSPLTRAVGWIVQGGNRMTHWATPPMDRDQIVLFSPTLDSMIAPDHPVRVFDEILEALDWSGWESQYVHVLGQPPIHPRVVASAILYGLSEGTRSSRRLERACGTSMDYLWLVRGRSIDHSTFCEFRTKFREPLKDLFRQVGRVAMEMGMIRLGCVALDGTKVKANSSRHATARAATLAERLGHLDRQVEEALSQMEAQDAADRTFFPGEDSPQHLPRKWADLKRRREQLREALRKAQAKQETAEKGKTPKVPVADPEASISPNKEGGFAPNYTPVATVAEGGLIVAAEVLEDGDESEAVLPAVEAVEANLGQRPAEMLADSAFQSGPNLRGLQDRGVEGYIPSARRQDTADNPARREDPRQPVPAGQRDRLPLDSGTKRLSRTAFLYDASARRYFCPMGKTLEEIGTYTKTRRKTRILYQRYRCGGCDGCPLKERCVPRDSVARLIDRDEHEPLREAMDVRMRSEEARRRRGLRSHLAEGTFAVLKQVMGVRQFLLRGLAKVRMEWTWAAVALNLRRMAARWRSKVQGLDGSLAAATGRAN
jgi:transposase